GLGGFAGTLGAFVDGAPTQKRFHAWAALPAKTPLSDTISKDLKRRGFNFVGSTIVYALMQATGMVNDHLVTCPRHAACAALASRPDS
ncbi:MAG: DNA-3-methyladenine glycosylase I, partial [Planctomycetota bacterium]